MHKLKLSLLLVGVLGLGSPLLADSVTLHGDGGDTLMIHRLNNGELWGSFMITDRIADSFADHELIVLQVDAFQPVRLDYQKQCGGAGRPPPSVDYGFSQPSAGGDWLLGQVTPSTTDILALMGEREAVYRQMRSDRRPELVDFPIEGALAAEGLAEEFRRGEKVVFHYTTDAGETRQAEFSLKSARTSLDGL